jgi:hypothetical protein
LGWGVGCRLGTKALKERAYTDLRSLVLSNALIVLF